MTLQATLEIAGVSKSFGGVHAVADVSFFMARGEVTALIGPNGAGKTTLINLLTGVLPADRGTIRLEGRDLAGTPAYMRARAGIARTYQTPQMAQGMSVLMNVMAGAYRFGKHGLLGSLLRPWLVMADNEELAERAGTCLARVGVSEEWWGRPAADLPYGHQRRVEIARALAQDPKLLLLDEPAAGLNRSEADELASLLVSIAADGRAVLLVEHDMGMVMSISSHIVVLNFGRKLAEGAPETIKADKDVIAAYLGIVEEVA
ncbi:MAG: ABC transporter ATP-binding protein [Bradyrhizobium sp.]|uniref:ABC transporter ATP-binding protein n=1 Tax=Bradyrhizobium sp. TaxID=376 RepID=UPI001A2C9DF7|nr:ABC transporter ATP-binding protein [Bradyrhizobium sp.]MBJ7403801.1 ABC transporter ATP-binding protein [Bradyrhizobium sp.]